MYFKEKLSELHDVENLVHCPPRNHAGIIATGKTRPNVKFAAFGRVVFDKTKGRS